jgi:hypothetical protein
MRINSPKATTMKAAVFAVAILLLVTGTSLAQQTINLTAAPSAATLPDGSSVPMWGYTCSVTGTALSLGAQTCGPLNSVASGGWAPIIITVPTGEDLQIQLTNSLPSPVPTSLVIVGQLGGGLGTTSHKVDSPEHAAQSLTWPAAGGPTDPVNNPPVQGQRVQSFSTEVATGATSSPLIWTAANLRPGTYLIESGTHPSIQGPMGLYGILVVTTAPTTTPTAALGTAYPGVNYDADISMLFSEIDPVQNRAVYTAVNTPGFEETKVWSGLSGQCGDPNAPAAVKNTCYPPAVNYSPLYYLINGVAFNKTNATASLFSATPGTTTTPVAGNVLVRLVNAGLRMHVPSIVGAQTGVGVGTPPVAPAGFSLIAEDGNILPGSPHVQSEVFMAAGKTYDVMINVPAADAKALPIYDRQLSLSGNKTSRDGGMLAYIGINGSTAPSVPSAAAIARADSYTSVFDGQTLTISDPTKGLIANDSNVYSVAVSTAPTHGVLALQPNGTFTYTPSTSVTSTFSDSFTYCANGSTTTCAAVTLGAAPIEAASGIVMVNSSFTSSHAKHITVAPPGILAADKDNAGYPLEVALGTVTISGSGWTVNPDKNGGFTADVPGAGVYTFTYKAQNSQGTQSSSTATVTLNFPTPSNLAVSVVDGQDKSAITDYRWIIEEDRTFYVNPNNTVNTGLTVLPAFGANFHTSYMPVVAQGCTGANSCESGQSVGSAGAVCDLGNGACRTDASQKTATFPKDVLLDPTKRYYISILPGDAMGVDGSGGDLGTSHAMGGAQIAAGQTSVQVIVEPLPLPAAKVSVMVFEDDFPTNGEQDTGGGVDVLAPNEPGLGGFNITLFDDVGGSGDAAGQMTYDMFGNPLSNTLAGTPDPTHPGVDACPVSANSRTGIDAETGAGGAASPTGITGMITVCPKYESDGVTLSPLAGQALVANLPPGRYGVVATPGADRIAKGEEWLQTNTLDGGAAHDSFIRANEPNFFQEYGPAGYHVAIGFANPAIINSRKADVCAPLTGANSCSPGHTITGKVTGVHMSRTPDERLYSTGTRDTFGYTQCYVSLGSPDGADFAFAKCDDQGVFTFTGMPGGDWRITVFDQWNDQIVDGISTPVRVNQATVDMGDVAVHQWKTNLTTSTFFDQNGNGVREDNEPGLALVYTNVRYRDGSFSNFNSTDLDGAAGFNEVFPLFNWYVVETDSTRYKNTGTHVVYDAGGPVDGSPACGQAGYPACGTSTIAQNLARTKEDVPLPSTLRFPGARYCANADCPTGDAAGGSTGRVDPPWVTSEGWQGFIGQNQFLEFGKRPFNTGENGGIRGDVVYASTRPFDDPALLLQLSWEPQVPNVTVNLYQEGTAADGTTSLKLVDTTTTSSWDAWAQGFRSDGNPNMNCPGQGRDTGTNADLFFFTIQNQPMYLNPGTLLPNNSQFKCFDGMHNWNQLQPAPYDGHYVFPSVTSRNPTTGIPDGTNCSASVCTQGADGEYQLKAGKYVVEMIVPPGYELVKEEDKNILMGDTYIAPVTVQFAGFGAIFIMPDQATIGETYYGQPANNPNNPLIPTSDEGVVPRHEGDTGSIETFWPCVGELRTVPDYMSLFPGAGQNAPFAGAKRPLCDRKEVTLEDQMGVLAKFYVFTSTHVAAHFTGLITDDFTAEFDPFSPQFGEKFAPANLPVSIKDWAGNEISRVYADQWGAYNGLSYSTWGVNPPDPSGYVPTMMVTCMNDIGDPAHPDALFQPQYSQFCYETPFMPGQTQYMDTPVVPTSGFAGAGYNNPDCAYPDASPAISSVTTTDAAGPWISATGTTHRITINALGDQKVNNYGYAGPSATLSPFNQRTVTRHYGFGDTQGTGTVKIGGVTASVVSWSDSTIVVTLASNPPACPAPQQQTVFGGSAARCGQLVITNGNGKVSVDTVTVTVGGKAPKTLTAGQTIQSAIDKANPGDLIIVPPGTYSELLVMWKPVRLQGVGAASTVINASSHPSGVLLDPWRQRINCLFGLTPEGQPGPGAGCGSGWTNYDTAHPQVDRIPLEGILGWDATVNGNLAEQLMEPSIMGAYEGAAITVLGKGVKLATTLPFSPAAFGTGAEADFPADASLLTSTAGDCPATGNTNRYSGNFLCNPSSIDGFGVTNSSQGGGGIFVHGWGHNLQIANNRVANNTGTLSGGVTIGIAETPDAYLTGDVIPPPGSCRNGGILPGEELPFCFDRLVSVHNNAIVTNSSIGDELFSSTASGAGGISFSAGSDNYSMSQNWVCGNLSSGDGGGVVHLGYSENGLIEHNSILFNQSSNPTIPASGGGIMVMSTAPDGAPPNSPAGTECGSVTDVDCAPGLGDGTGNLKINANLIMGNAAEAGSGGGIRLQGVNGTEVSRFPILPGQWYQVDITNNIIVNNVAGWDGAGVSMVDSLKVNLVNNTIASNDSTASSGALFTTFRTGKGLSSGPIPGCTTPTCLAAPQPAGVATEPNSAGLTASLPVLIICPAGHSSGLTNPLIPIIVPNGTCRSTSFPILYNNLIWKNRAFHLDVGGLNNQYQQNMVTLTPTLNQPAAGATTPDGNGVIVTGGTGACVTPPTGTYWDIGVRGDTGPANHGSGVTLTPVSSVLSSGGYATFHNSGSDPTVVRQYCNGSRVPPEFGGLGYQVPPGTNEGNVPTPLFNLTANATVDEGNNWINISWGPLALTNPVSGTVLGNYALATGSPSIDYISQLNSTVSWNAAPVLDFFNNSRKNAGNPNVDVGAVEGAGNVGGGVAAISPTSVAFDNVAVNNNSLAWTLTLTNNTGAALTGITVTPATTSTPTTPNVFSRPAGAAGGTCSATLANGSNCTILVVFRPVAVAAYTGTLTISGSAGVIGSPVALGGTGFTPTAPALTVLDNFNRANASTLGGNWLQGTLLGVAAIQVNTNQASDPTVAGTAFWNPAAFAAKEGGAFTIANATLNNDALILAATGTPVLSVYPNFIRVLYNGGTVTVATTTSGGLAYTAAGTISGAFANGNTLTAVLDGTNAVAAPTVYLFNGTTFVGAVQITPNALWQGGGRIGMQMPVGGRVDNFAGGIVP